MAYAMDCLRIFTEVFPARLCVPLRRREPSWWLGSGPGGGVAAPPPGRESVLSVQQLLHLRRDAPRPVELTPRAQAGQRSIADLGQQPAHPVRLRLPHRQVVLDLQQEDPWYVGRR